MGFLKLIVQFFFVCGGPKGAFFPSRHKCLSFLLSPLGVLRGILVVFGAPGDRRVSSRLRGPPFGPSKLFPVFFFAPQR